MKTSSPTDNPVTLGSERSQLLVRIPTEHALLAKRLAARADTTLAEYIDQLIVADIADKADEVRAEIDSWRAQTLLEIERETAAVANVVKRASEAG